MKKVLLLIICVAIATVFISCTKNPLFTLLPEPTTSTATSTATNNTSYIGNINTLKFHKTTCGSLPDPINRITFTSRASAVSVGYIPCGICKP